MDRASYSRGVPLTSLRRRTALIGQLNALSNDVQAAVASALGKSNDGQNDAPAGPADPSIVLAADKDNKEKRPSLPGGANRPSLGDELPPPKQIDPLGGRGIGSFRLPGGGPKAPTQGV